MREHSCVTSAMHKAQPLNGLATLGTAALVTVAILWTLDASPTQGSWRTRLSRGFESPGAQKLVTNARPHGLASNVTVHCANVSDSQPPPSRPLQWIRFPTQENVTQTILRRVGENGTLPCHRVKTSRLRIEGLPTPDGDNRVVLRAGAVHRFAAVAYDDRGEPRCAGGDYYETDLSGPSWKSRPPVLDYGNGSYSLCLQVDRRFVGLYVLKVVLLFGNYNGLHLRPERWARKEELVNLEIEFVSGDDDPTTVVGPPLNRCRADSDYGVDAWSGRWTRVRHNDSCDINSKGRFECLDPDEPCSKPWCDGPVGRLESNGWVYSAHCSFKIFRQEEAWDCLDKRWLFFWGDSNHVDTIRNLLNFVLGSWDVKSVPRRFDRRFQHPADGSRHVRITNMFNGHSNETKNYQGVFSLTDHGFRRLLRSFFEGDSVPDTMIMNSGLHDGVYWRNVRLFADGAERAAEFWESVLKSVEERQRRKPVFLYRTTIATGGYARALWFNPQKMETFNHILLEKLRRRNLVSIVVDDFDLTYAWHFDNNCSDGVHYGRAPARSKWHGQIGHQYFVDLMLVHILLNAICP